MAGTVMLILGLSCLFIVYTMIVFRLGFDVGFEVRKETHFKGAEKYARS